VELRDLIGDDPHTCGVSLTLEEASRSMHAVNTGSIGIVQEGDLVGILTERDILRAVAMGADLSSESVGSWMSHPVQTFDAETPVDEAALRLLEREHRHLPVTSDGRLVGILSIRDVLGALVEPDRR
jgi:CBS domain-containing protein